jgi:hypothetical protein
MKLFQPIPQRGLRVEQSLKKNSNKNKKTLSLTILVVPPLSSFSGKRTPFESGHTTESGYTTQSLRSKHRPITTPLSRLDSVLKFLIGSWSEFAIIGKRSIHQREQLN